jgi:hypothetical protein
VYVELEACGQSEIMAPNLYKMASEGRKFTRYYRRAPVYAPSSYNQPLSEKGRGGIYI